MPCKMLARTVNQHLESVIVGLRASYFFSLPHYVRVRRENTVQHTETSHFKEKDPCNFVHINSMGGNTNMDIGFTFTSNLLKAEPGIKVWTIFKQEKIISPFYQRMI